MAKYALYEGAAVWLCVMLLPDEGLPDLADANGTGAAEPTNGAADGEQGQELEDLICLAIVALGLIFLASSFLHITTAPAKQRPLLPTDTSQSGWAEEHSSNSTPLLSPREIVKMRRSKIVKMRKKIDPEE